MTIPGLDWGMEEVMQKDQKKVPQKKVPYAKPIPAQFQQVRNSTCTLIPSPCTPLARGTNESHWGAGIGFPCIISSVEGMSGCPIDFLELSSHISGIIRHSLHRCFAVSAEFVMNLLWIFFYSHLLLLSKLLKEDKRLEVERVCWPSSTYFFCLPSTLFPHTMCKSAHALLKRQAGFAS